MRSTAFRTPPQVRRSNPRERGSGVAPFPLVAEHPHRPSDDVLDAGLDSFPASDPPSWSPLRAGAPAS